jgi:hypothetical protein
MPKISPRQRKRIKKLMLTLHCILDIRNLDLSSQSNGDYIQMLVIYVNSVRTIYIPVIVCSVIICFHQTVDTYFWWFMTTESILGRKGFHKVSPSSTLESLFGPSSGPYLLGSFGFYWQLASVWSTTQSRVYSPIVLFLRSRIDT